MRISLLFRSKRLVHFLSLVSASKSDLMLAFLIHSWLPENKRDFAVLRSVTINCVCHLQCRSLTTWQKTCFNISSSPQIFMIYGSMGINTISIPWISLIDSSYMKTFQLVSQASMEVATKALLVEVATASRAWSAIKGRECGMLSASFCCLLVFMKGIESKVGTVERFQ